MESDEYFTASCIYSNKILSCVNDKKDGQQDEQLIYLSFEKHYGSVTWNGGSTEQVNIPRKIQLTHSQSYYLTKYDTKYEFMLKASSSHGIPENSLIIVDISYEESQKTANCQVNSLTAANEIATFSCEFDYNESNNPEFKLIIM